MNNYKKMKRNIITLIFLAFTFGPFIACEKQEEQILQKKDWFVAFEGQNATISKTSSSLLRIPVYVAAGTGSPVSVTIGINTDSTTAVAGVDYQFVKGPVLNYPNGAGFDTLRIQPLSPGNPGRQTLWLKLESNTAGYKMGFSHGPDADSTSYADFKITFQ
jgi:hypothetical protein